MAAVFLSPAPHKLGGMTNKRVPLGNVPNAANSPFRAVAAAASKRSRDIVEAQEDLSYDIEPRAKKQALEDGRPSQRISPRKQKLLQSAEARIFNRRPIEARPGPFEQKLLAAAQDSKVRQRVDRHEKSPQEQKDGVRQWQKHYRKSFLSFVFYFESLPEDIRISCSKCIRSLGAREEKFFSKEVTHVVTTRPIPSDSDTKDPLDMTSISSTSIGSQHTKPSGTINPSWLDRQSEPMGQHSLSRNRAALEAITGRRGVSTISRDLEPRKGTGNADILSKAKEMGMKVWSLDKLQRVTDTLLSVSNESQIQSGHQTRARGATVPAKADKQPDLSRMLKNERINGPSDRDATVLTELVPFKGCYIYVRDIDERTKPILVRDYPKPAPDEYSEWPQFQSVSLGKCPFVPEADPPTRQEYEKAKAREEESHARAKAMARRAPRTRAATVRHDAEVETESAREMEHQRPLRELRNKGNVSIPPLAKVPAEALCPPPSKGTKTKSPAKVARDFATTAGTRLFGGEPAASGMQPSNITSAIRSQMISSTAAAPGAKAGTSKEVHGLKRKVLERNSAPAINSLQTKQREVDPNGEGRAEKTIPAARRTRQQAQAPLIHIDEESTQSEGDEDVWLTEDVRRQDKQQKQILERNPRPGYCENCREKYDDFDDHIIGRKHRKFALTHDNWKDLDRLLAKLGRQLREPYPESDVEIM